MMNDLLLKDVTPGKIFWVGGYPAHYVRRMHIDVEVARPGVMHFVYITDYVFNSERSYENGKMPLASSILKADYSVIDFLRSLNQLKPKAMIVAGYNHRLQIASLLWSYWARVRFCFWCDTNLLDVFQQSKFRLLFKSIGLKWTFSRAHRLLYIGSRNRDYYVWLFRFSSITEKLYFLPYPALFTYPSVKTSLNTVCCGQQQRREFHILYLGRLEPIKAVHKLLNALALLPAAIISNVHLDIYGGGSEEVRLKELSVKYSVSDSVSFHGPIESDQVFRAYVEADLFVLPSDKEPWGLVVNEAMSFGVPVMCPFWVGAAADLITDGETGYVLENNIPSCIAAGIERAYIIGRGNSQLGENARKRIIRGGWNVDAASASLVKLLDELSY